MCEIALYKKYNEKKIYIYILRAIFVENWDKANFRPIVEYKMFMKR